MCTGYARPGHEHTDIIHDLTHDFLIMTGNANNCNKAKTPLWRENNHPNDNRPLGSFRSQVSTDTPLVFLSTYLLLYAPLLGSLKPSECVCVCVCLCVVAVPRSSIPPGRDSLRSGITSAERVTNLHRTCDPVESE